jgi:hypothetical protein
MATPEEIESSKKGLEDLSKNLKDLANPVKAIGIAIADVTAGADGLNKSFTLSRARIQEMKVAFADSSVEVLRLGGSLGDTLTTITQIADASNRNVIENKKVVSELYASSEILGITAKELVNNFKDVGYETSQIGPNIEKSITYVQSVGLNASTVMKSVSANMEQMNRFQFEGGVAGLTKMAAQSSMLRFDMSQTFQFADKMLKPENAINMSAAFQRLGVTAGNLIDPFALMNQSLNDPTGLNNSLARLGEKFVYFSEEAQAFKINPEGVRILREIEEEAGLASGSLAKSALAAADLDKRLSQVSAAGLKFENEEDKQYLANIAAMGKGGKYEVKIDDETTKQLQDLSQEEFDKLIKQQKDAPKSLEEIQRSQLGFTKNVAADISAILALFKFSIANDPRVRTNIEGFRNVLTSITGTASKKTTEKDKEIAKFVSEGVTEGFNLIKDIQSGNVNVSPTDILSKFTEIQTKIINNASGISGEAVKAVKELLKESAQKVKGNSTIEQMFRDTMGVVSSGVSASGTKSGTQTQIKTKQVAPVSKNAIMGTATTLKNYSETFNEPKQVNSKVDLGGVITIKVDAPPGVSQQQLTTYFESESFKRMIYEYWSAKSKELERRK